MLEKIYGGGQTVKQTELRKVVWRRIYGGMTFSCCWVENQPGPGSPTVWAPFQGCSTPTGSWSTWPWQRRNPGQASAAGEPGHYLTEKLNWPWRHCSCLDVRASLCFIPSSIPQPDVLSPPCCSILLSGPWAVKLVGDGESSCGVLFYTRDAGSVQLSVWCWGSHLTSLCLSCHSCTVGSIGTFTW